MDKQWNPDGQLATQAGIGCEIVRTVRDQLIVQKKYAELRLQDVNDAIEALDKHPGVEDLLNKMRKVGV